MKAFEDAIQNTSTKDAPWYIVPADKKWFTRLAVSEIVIKKMESLNLQYPKISEAQRQSLLEAKKILESE